MLAPFAAEIGSAGGILGQQSPECSSEGDYARVCGVEFGSDDRGRRTGDGQPRS